MKYQELKEELKDTYIELSLNLRIGRIALFHLLGRTILENEDIVPEDKFLSLAYFIGVAVDDLANAVLFAHKYPNFKEWEEKQDKTVNWETIKKDLNGNTET